jgi:hypothetical protein
LLNQRKYCLYIIAEHGPLGCKPATTPIDPSNKILDNDGDPLPDPTFFSRLIGQLLYLTNTRLDISFIVHKLSQFVSSLPSTHLQAALRMVRYLKGAPAFGLFYYESVDSNV